VGGGKQSRIVYKERFAFRNLPEKVSESRGVTIRRKKKMSLSQEGWRGKGKRGVWLGGGLWERKRNLLEKSLEERSTPYEEGRGGKEGLGREKLRIEP